MINKIISSIKTKPYIYNEKSDEWQCWNWKKWHCIDWKFQYRPYALHLEFSIEFSKLPSSPNDWFRASILFLFFFFFNIRYQWSKSSWILIWRTAKVETERTVKFLADRSQHGEGCIYADHRCTASVNIENRVIEKPIYVDRATDGLLAILPEQLWPDQ